MSYTLCWDNVCLAGKAKHTGILRDNPFKMWALTFAVNSRVPGRLSLARRNTVEARHLPAATFLPTASDLVDLVDRMTVVVACILAEYMLVSDVPDRIRHTPHQHTRELQQRSILVIIVVFKFTYLYVLGSYFMICLSI